MEDALAPSEMEVGEASAMTRSQQFADPLHTLDPWSQAAGQAPLQCQARHQPISLGKRGQALQEFGLSRPSIRDSKGLSLRVST